MKYRCADGMQITLRKRVICWGEVMENNFILPDNEIMYHREERTCRNEVGVAVSGL